MCHQGTPEDSFLPTEQGVMAAVLGELPALLTFRELVMEIGSEIAVTDALRDLIAAGLLHREGEVIFSTRAARRARLMG